MQAFKVMNRVIFIYAGDSFVTRPDPIIYENRATTYELLVKHTTITKEFISQLLSRYSDDRSTC